MQDQLGSPISRTSREPCGSTLCRTVILEICTFLGRGQKYTSRCLFQQHITFSVSSCMGYANTRENPHRLPIHAALQPHPTAGFRQAFSIKTRGTTCTRFTAVLPQQVEPSMWIKRFSFDRCFFSGDGDRNTNKGDGQEKVKAA